jgi:hypothetical protein
LRPKDGRVIGVIRPNRRKPTVLAFLLPALDQELATLPTGGRLHVVLDNLNIHHSREVTSWAGACIPVFTTVRSARSSVVLKAGSRLERQADALHLAWQALAASTAPIPSTSTFPWR